MKYQPPAIGSLRADAGLVLGACTQVIPATYGSKLAAPGA